MNALVFNSLADVKMSSVPISAVYVKHMDATFKKKIEAIDLKTKSESKQRSVQMEQRPFRDSFYKAGMISRASIQAAKLFLFHS